MYIHAKCWWLNMVYACIELCCWILTCYWRRLWWCMHVLNYVVEFLHAIGDDFVGVCMYWIMLLNSYMLLMTTWWCKHVLKNVDVDYWWFVWTYALLFSHMFMHSWLMVTYFISILTTTRFYIHIDFDYDVFVASWGDDLGDEYWYHIHIGVVSRRITWVKYVESLWCIYDAYDMATWRCMLFICCDVFEKKIMHAIWDLLKTWRLFLECL